MIWKRSIHQLERNHGFNFGWIHHDLKKAKIIQLVTPRCCPAFGLWASGADLQNQTSDKGVCDFLDHCYHGIDQRNRNQAIYLLDFEARQESPLFKNSSPRRLFDPWKSAHERRPESHQASSKHYQQLGLSENTAFPPHWPRCHRRARSCMSYKSPQIPGTVSVLTS